jgi:hypothetical protein
LHFLFIDESGSPPHRDKARGAYLIICGVIIPEGAWHGIARAYRAATETANGEVKWKHFGSGNRANSISHLSQEARESLRHRIFRIITSRKAVKLIACVTSVEAAYAMPTIATQDDVYHLTYKAVTERFQYYLQDASRLCGQPQYGIVVSDHREQDNDKKLRARHHELIDTHERFSANYSNIIETIFFSPSEASVGLRLADMAAGAVHRSFQHADNRFAEMLRPSFRTSPRGDLRGYGLVRMPRHGFVEPEGRAPFA